jgi:hypothetical protein
MKQIEKLETEQTNTFLREREKKKALHRERDSGEGETAGGRRSRSQLDGGGIKLLPSSVSSSRSILFLWFYIDLFFDFEMVINER